MFYFLGAEEINKAENQEMSENKVKHFDSPALQSFI